MVFNTTLEVSDDNEIATIILSGELDASTASSFQAKVEQAAGREPKKLVLLMAELSYMASAGLRVLIFAKQRMGKDVDIYVVAPQKGVRDTIEKTGFHHSVIILEEYDRDRLGG